MDTQNDNNPKQMKKLSIHLEILDDYIWEIIFSLFDFCHHKESSFDDDDFSFLVNECNADIRYHNDIGRKDATWYPYGNPLSFDLLCDELRAGTTFFVSIVCKKHDESTNTPDLFPFITWIKESDIDVSTTNGVKDRKRDFSLGIDVTRLEKTKKNKYIYKVGQKISIVSDSLPVPTASERCLYYIDNYIDRNGDTRIKTSAFPYSRYKETNTEKEVPISKYFLPELPVNEKMYYAFSADRTKKGSRVIEKSINILDEKIKVKMDKVVLDRIESYPPFEEWLIKAFLFHLNSSTGKDIEGIYKKVEYTLHEYYYNIYELIQNIIFHTENKKGTLSLEFVKKNDIAEGLREKIPLYDEYGDEDRFLSFELRDNGNKGIVQTFNDESLSLLSFFDPTEILPDKDNHLTLRYAAHLGIKSFVSSVINHGGYFYVETNARPGFKSCMECYNHGIVELDELKKDQNGTFYRVVLPIADIEEQSVADEGNIRGGDNKNKRKSIPTRKKQAEFHRIQQGTSAISTGYYNNLTFNLCNIAVELPNDYSSNKEEQIKSIESIGNIIINNYGCSPNGGRRNFGINLVDYKSYNPNFLFKLIAYIRLNYSKDNQPETIVCYNISNELYDKILEIVEYHNIAISAKGQPIWSDEHAIVLMAKSRITILCGETKEKYRFVNNALSRYYTFPQDDEYEFSPNMENKFDRLTKHIRPYDVYVDSPSKFVSDVRTILNKKIEDIDYDESGCLVNIPARLGEKIYIDNFFQSDHLFQESYYAERFALIIARDFYDTVIKPRDKDCRTTNVILLGYNSYSKLLTEYVKKYIESLNINEERKNKIIVKNIVTGRDDSKTSEMQFDISGNEVKKIEQHEVQEDCYVVTIVPIATTLTTFDKIINNFQLFCKKNQLCINPLFQYNHCSILIRDSKGSIKQCSTMELEWNWDSIDDHLVKTTTKTIHYVVAMKTAWHHLIDKETFPNDYSEEKYILRTHNSSLNVENTLGYPDSFIYQDFTVVKERLNELKDYIYGGHIIHNNKHHRYYFDVPRYIEKYEKDSGSKLNDWVKNMNIHIGRINIIVTSEPDKDPQLTTFIKESLFRNRAHVLFLDLHDRNIKYKYSFLQLLGKDDDTVKYYFVDQALLTGKAYYTAKSQMASILGVPDFKFDSIVTIINRLSKTKYDEIVNDLRKRAEGGLFSFVQFLIPPSKIDDSTCYICNMETFFKNLKKNAVIKDCRSIIESNKIKYEKKEYEEAKKEEKNSIDFDRFYKRMIWQNRLFYEISKTCSEFLSSQIPDDEEVKQNGRGDRREETIDEKLILLHNESKKTIDDYISFIKAISTPPISDYARIRKTAFGILLKDLKEVLEKEKPRINDLYVLKVLLRHLALLESNALVRKDVIIGAWNTYMKVKNQLFEEIQEMKMSSLFNANEQDTIMKPTIRDISSYIGISDNNILDFNDSEIKKCINDKNNKLNKFPVNLLFYVKIATHKDPAKSLWLGELLRTGKEMNVDDFNNGFNVSRTKLFNNLFKQDGEGKEELLMPYLFYENTTIIRRTLDSFEYASGSLDLEKYREKVKENYNYHWFKLYFPIERRQVTYSHNTKIARDAAIDKSFSIEGIDLIQKYALVSEARRLLVQMTEPQENTNESFDENVGRLLHLFSEIMDAQSAFVTVCPRRGEYKTLSIYNKTKDYCIDKDKIIYDDSYYCKHIIDNQYGTTGMINDGKGRPFIMRKRIMEGTFSCCGESFNVFDRAAYLTLDRAKENQDVTIGLITFLYLKNESNNSFWRRTQELGRLLLLIKPEIDSYVIHVDKEKLYDIWAEKNKYYSYLRKINFTSGHKFIPKNYTFESLGANEIAKVYGEFWTMSNSVISYIFSLLLEDHKKEEDKKNLLNFTTYSCTISSIFDTKFQRVLKELNYHRWNNIWDEKVDINEFDIELSINPVIFRYFIVQCFYNAYLHSNCKQGDLGMEFQRDKMVVRNKVTKIPTTEEIKEFDKKYSIDIINRRIDEKRIEDYGLTLISLIKYCESVGCRCIPFFDTVNSNFVIDIFY